MKRLVFWFAVGVLTVVMHDCLVGCHDPNREFVRNVMR